MNRVLSEEIKIRKWIQTILIEDAINKNPDLMIKHMLSESGFTVPPDEMYRVFIEPFVDVFKAVKVGTKDLLSIAKLNLDLLLALSPSKMEAALQRYEKRTTAINKEWDETMKSTYEIMEHGDAALIGFMLNPAGFMGAKLALAVPGAAVDTVDFLEDAGWGLPVVGGLIGSGGGKDKDKDKGNDGKVDVLGTASKLLGDLTKLFFFAHHAPAGHIIVEKKTEEDPDEKKKEEKKAADTSEGVQQYMDSVPGLEDNIKGHAAELIAAKEEQIKIVLEMFSAQVELLQGLYEVRDLAGLSAVMNKAASAGVDIGGSGLGQFEGEIKQSVQKILTSPEAREDFVRSYLESQGEKVPDEKELAAAKEKQEKSGQPPAKDPSQPEPGALPEVSDEKLMPEIEKSVFMAATQDLQTQIYTGVQKMKTEVAEAIKTGIPPEEDWALVKQGAAGKTFIGMIEEALAKVDAA